MEKIKKLNFALKSKKKIKLILYISFFFLLFFTIYFSAPKFINFSTESIKKNLKKNNDINITNISKVVYKIFPTPRLSISNINFTIGGGEIEVSKAKIEIILRITRVLNFKEINYKKLLITEGSSKININNINNSLNYINKNNKKIIFRKNDLIFFYKNKVFFKIKDATIKIKQIANKKELIINGNFLNNNIFLKLDNSLGNKNNLTLKIPKLDITTKVFFEKKNSTIINGIFNLEIFNNFLKFNFTKNDNLNLTDGFIRSRLINSSLEGEIAFKPNFYSRLDFKPSELNIKKLIPVILKNYFSDDTVNLSLIKKINGIFKFKSKFEGSIINKNGEILLDNFKAGKNKSFYFNARIIELGKKGKVKFDLVKIIKHKKDEQKKIKIIGFLTLSNSKIFFEKFLLDGNKLSVKKTKKYENKFQNELIRDSLSNIFNEDKMERFFKNLL